MLEGITRSKGIMSAFSEDISWKHIEADKKNGCHFAYSISNEFPLLKIFLFSLPPLKLILYKILNLFQSHFYPSPVLIQWDDSDYQDQNPDILRH